MLNAKLLGGTAAAKTYIEDVFSTWLYTGNSSTQTITNGIDLSGKGGLVWIKGRAGVDGNGSHQLFDTDRGVGWRLASNGTGSQDLAANTLTAFNPDGFSLGSQAFVNGNATYASWTFRKAEKFFDVVTYTGNGSTQTINHNLGSVPGTIIVKRTDTTSNWIVYHRSLSSIHEYLVLNLTSAVGGSAGSSPYPWGATTPTSTQFSVGDNGAISSAFKTNASGGTYVAYLFAHDTGTDGLIQCGTMTGATTVNLGWEPQWLLIKRTDSTGDWQLFDTMRGLKADDATQTPLVPNTSAAEATSGSYGYRLTSTGFYSGNGGTYIYIAIRRGPMRTPTDATKVFSAVTYTGTSGAQTISTGLAGDLYLGGSRTLSSQSIMTADKLRGSRAILYTSLTNAENTLASDGISFTNTSLVLGTASASSGVINVNGYTGFAGVFRRAPGFFDVVAYTGTGSARTVSHNLGVVPELMIIKNRGSDPWTVYSNATGVSNYLSLNSTAASTTDSSSSNWNGTSPTSTVFSVKDSGWVNGTGGQTYIAYLFATCPGVSKVGSYTGTGTTKQIDCGFTAGARFVLIKRTDSTGDWYMWDSARGIVSGNDPYVLANQLVNETTGTDYIDPLNSGFEISSTAPAAINANGGSYIFLAIA